jgi:hypothetical protein
MRILFSKRQPPRSNVPEHYNGPIKLPHINTNHLAEDIYPKWVDLVFKPVFVELVKTTPNQWWPAVAGNVGEVDSKLLPPPSLMTSVEVEYQQEDWNQCLFKATTSALRYCGL